MSTAGIEAHRTRMENYFIKHSRSRTISIVGGDSFPALFNYASMSNNRDSGNIEQQKLVPHITFFSGNAALLTARTTEVIVPLTFDSDGNTTSSETFLVYKIDADETSATFQAEAWLS